MKFKFALTSLFFLSNCVKYESPLFYFHNVSDRPLKEINCEYNGNKFGFDGLWLMGSLKDMTANGSTIKNPSFSAIKLFSYEISNDQEFYGKMVCNLKNFKGETKNFQFEVGKNDIELPEKRHFITKPWLMPAYLIAGVILPSGVGKNRKMNFFFTHINIYLSQDGYEIVFSNDKNYFDKDNFYIEIMQKNELNYIKEKTLNKNLNY